MAIALGALALALPAIEAWRSTAAWAIPLGFLVTLLVIELLRAPYTLHSKLESEVMLLRERLSDR